MLLLVPADVLHPRRVDAHFAAEADAARAAGLDVAVLDHDAAARPGGANRAVIRVPGGTTAVYRGWMITADRYTDLASALADRDVRLVTTPAAYRAGHELPGWYPALAGHTPATVWTAGTDRPGFDAARRRLGGGPAVLRDYCKSMKHHWHEAAYIPDLADGPASWLVAGRFRELRGEELVGGFVLRRFEAFTGAEVRTWWVGGVCHLVTAHPDTPDAAPAAGPSGTGTGTLRAALGALAPVVAGLGLPFVTVDLARRADGAWRVVELGDGQVSDRPASTPAEEIVGLLRALGEPAAIDGPT